MHNFVKQLQRMTGVACPAMMSCSRKSSRWIAAPRSIPSFAIIAFNVRGTGAGPAADSRINSTL
jgi:hypothetical protein